MSAISIIAEPSISAVSWGDRVFEQDELVDIYAVAGITKPQMPWHCLRHSFCTRLANSGASIHIIKEMAGHKSIETTLRYMHTTEHEKRAAIDRVFAQ